MAISGTVPEVKPNIPCSAIEQLMEVEITHKGQSSMETYSSNKTDSYMEIESSLHVLPYMPFI